MKLMTCHKCADDFDEDTILWLDESGRLTMSGKPYCEGCAPEQPNYEGEGE